MRQYCQILICRDVSLKQICKNPLFICRARSFTTLTLRSRMTNELTLLVVQTNASVTSRGTLAHFEPARHSRAKCSARSEESCAEHIHRNLFSNSPINPNLSTFQAFFYFIDIFDASAENRVLSWGNEICLACNDVEFHSMMQNKIIFSVSEIDCGGEGIQLKVV